MNTAIVAITSRAQAGDSTGLGCQTCFLADECGGVGDFDCYAGCCNKPSNCTICCPRSRNWVKVAQDGGGLQMRRSYAISQRSESLPLYIPRIDNKSGRNSPIETPYVALNTFDVARPYGKRYLSPEDLRFAYGISSSSKVLLLSVEKDPRLELHWKYSKHLNLAQYLFSLGISHVTAPNFSYSLSEPRPEHLVNRSRSLIEAERLSAAGLSVIPHVNAFTLRDWEAWRDFFREHENLKIISQEFQTGLRNPKRAGWHIERLTDMEQALGRSLHLVAIGGRNHITKFSRLSGYTIVDTNPFVKTTKRFALEGNRWVKTITETPREFENLLIRNVNNYSSYIELCKRNALVAFLKAEPLTEEIPAEPESLQLDLFRSTRVA